MADRAARIHVESWSPEYGSPFDPDESYAPPEGSVDDTVETSTWSPRQGLDDGVDLVTFVDGVRRIDARLTVDDPVAGPIPGICGTFAVGAVTWDRRARRSEIGSETVERWAVLGRGRPEVFPIVDLDPPYTTVTTTDEDPSALIRALHAGMRRAEAALAASLAGTGFVVADGPLHDTAPGPVVGYVKSHHVEYLPPERSGIVAALARGERTPLFTIADHARYSWYVRLAELPGGHSWSGVVRCETSGGWPLPEAIRIADRTAALLPHVASEPHIDPRAPQNLVPIAALERALRHRMGERGLVERALRAAVSYPTSSERRAS